MEPIELVVEGKPYSKARPRFFHKGSFVGTYKPAKEAEAESRFSELARVGLLEQGVAEPLEADVALRVVCEFEFEMPHSWSATKKFAHSGRPHLGKPDVDNLLKFAMDALNGVAWKDDKQVSLVAASKRWSEHSQTRVVIASDL